MFSFDFSGKFNSWVSRRLLGDEQKNGNKSLVLAQERTTRKDPLDKFKKYRGGWNIKERHYWAVSFLILYLLFTRFIFLISCFSIRIKSIVILKIPNW